MTDVRHVMQEAWRVVRQRRWLLVFPFCAVSTLALICSLWVPRQYTVTTIVKREHDPVLTSMMGAAWTQPYAEIRTRMLADLQNEEVIAEILEEMNLPPGVERFPNGELTPAGEAQRATAVAAVAQGLTVQSLESSNNRDIAVISLTLSDSGRLTELLATLRDRYIKRARERTVRILRDAEQFFRTESERCGGELAVLQKAMIEFEMRYPSINPDHLDPTRTEQATLAVERLGLERKLGELTARRTRLAEKLSRAAQAPSGEALEADGALELQTNPRYVEVTQEIGRLMREIADKKMLRGMTDHHPTIQQLRTTLGMRQAELAEMPREIPASAKTAGAGAAGESPAERLAQDLTESDAEIAAQKSRLEAVADQIAEMERTRALAAEHRQDYLKLKQRADSLAAELNSWQRNIDPIQHLFTAEDRNRTVHLTTVKEVEAVERPSSPQAAFVTGVCLAIGLATAVLFVLLIELVDRSYRTVKHLKTSLGVPVIEGIDEIITAAARRRRTMRRLVIMPAAALIGFSTLVAAAVLAYLSLQSPSKYEALKSTPSRWYQLVGGTSRPILGSMDE